MIGSLFRSLEVSLHERLAMIEDVIRIGKTRNVSVDDDVESLRPTDIVIEKLTAIEDCLNSLAARVTAIESAANAVAATAPKETVHVNRLAQTSSEQLYIHPMKGVEIVIKDESTPVASAAAAVAGTAASTTEETSDIKMEDGTPSVVVIGKGDDEMVSV